MTVSVSVTDTLPPDLRVRVILNIHDLSRITGMRPGAIRQSLHLGVFPIRPIYLGRRLRWRTADVLNWLHEAATAK